MEMGFSIIYLTFIFCIILIMTLRMQLVKPEFLLVAKRFRLAFVLLFIGDLAHVGVRLWAIASGTLGESTGLSGISSAVELISIYCLMMCLTNIWAMRFQKSTELLYRSLMGCGIVGIILILVPQSVWASLNPPLPLSTIQMMPWVIQGITTAIIMILDGRRMNDGFYSKLGWILIPAIACYSPSALFPGTIPLPFIALMMVVGTILFMMMQYAPLKEYFLKRS